MSKTILNLLMASLLLIFVAGCGGGGGGSDSATNTSSNTSPIPNVEPTDSNLAPVANAGADQTVPVGSLATLDGTGSYDPDNNTPLTYEWEITSTPDGSNAVSSSSDSSESTFDFEADLPGDYMIKLVVTDSLGKASDSVYVKVSTSNSMPIADAGDDQFLSETYTAVQLDGSTSFDPDGDPITYAWSITSKPPYSEATLDDPTAAKPTFEADSLGTYVIELTVTDDKGIESFPDEVVVTSENVKPVADAGGNQIVLLGDIVELDGSGSYDANGNDLTYSWNITSTPKHSLTELINSETVNPTFTPDVWGFYTVSLVVNDGSLDSEPDSATILAAEYLDPFLAALTNAVHFINELDDSYFNNPNNKDALTLKILVIAKNYIEDGYSDAMFVKLRDDVAGKMDGCDRDGGPDGNDWIIKCDDDQHLAYSYIVEALTLLAGMSS